VPRIAGQRHPQDYLRPGLWSRRRLPAVLACIAAVAGCPAAAHAQRTAAPSVTAAPPDIDRYVAEVLRTFDVPGVAVTIVKDGRVVLAKGYGVKKLGGTDPVDADTKFGIASNTKLFTATALGLLVEEGKVAWDRPVIDYLPWFRLSDPYVTSQLTVRDLLVHRSGFGLGAGDLLWWPASTYDRAEIARRLRYIPLATSFRSAYAYDNVLYLVAGQLIEAVSGMSWEDFVKTRIIDRIGMTHTAVRHSAALEGGNVAVPHAAVNGEVRAIAPFGSDNTNPAGGIMSGANDMARWLTVQLDSGRVGTSRLFTPATARQLWTLVTPIGIGNPAPELAPQRASFYGYALGLFVRDYRGRKLLLHTGGLPGYVSRVFMVPDMKLGVAILTNQESGAAFDAIGYHILDHFMDAPPHDWLASYRAVVARGSANVAAAERNARAARDSLSTPSLPIANYAGTYRDAWYGDVVIENAGNAGVAGAKGAAGAASAAGLVMRFTKTPALVGDLVHWQYDTFLVRWRDRELRADAFATFQLNPDGSVSGIRMVAASPAVDFSFDFQDLDLERVR
jgi:CubicO group peptidase (beta-lactamase class C family)